MNNGKTAVKEIPILRNLPNLPKSGNLRPNSEWICDNRFFGQQHQGNEIAGFEKITQSRDWPRRSQVLQKLKP
jgi:hypothetical protein